MNKPIYYESHITIEPIFGERLDHFTRICEKYVFTPAKLFMQKERDVVPERSDKDTFCTGKSNDFALIKNRTILLVDVLRAEKFKVWRYKIEAILIDEKFERI